MKKVFFKSENNSAYWFFDNKQTQNYELSNLCLFLNSWGKYEPEEIHTSVSLTWEWLRLEKTDDNKMVFLWNPSDVKYKYEQEFNSQAEKDVFEAAYEDYFIKRWHDAPKLHMTIENYVEIVQKWQEIVLKQRPTYIIFSQDDQGYVNLIGQDELTEQDKIDITREHEKFLKRNAAYEKYINSIPNLRIDDFWRSPDDSEFEADWQKFLDEPLDYNNR